MSETLATQAVRVIEALRCGPRSRLDIEDFSVAEIDEAIQFIEALVSANARLERERDEARKALSERILHWQDAIAQRDAAIAARAAAEWGRADVIAALEIAAELPSSKRCQSFVQAFVEEAAWAIDDVRKRRARPALTPAPEAPKDGE